MSHHITAIITTPAGAIGLGELAASLPQGFVIVALTEAVVARLDDGATVRFTGWELTTPRLIERLRELVAEPFALIETEYFGGHGYQRAGAWHRDRVLLAPEQRQGAVSAALAAIGVARGQARDEWDALELVRFRSNDRIADATSAPSR